MIDARLAHSGLPELTGHSADDEHLIWRTFSDLLSVTFDALRSDDPDMTGDVVAEIVADNMGLRWKREKIWADAVTVYLSPPPRPRWWRRGILRYAFWHASSGVTVHGSGSMAYGAPDADSPFGGGRHLLPHSYEWR